MHGGGQVISIFIFFPLLGFWFRFFVFLFVHPSPTAPKSEWPKKNFWFFCFSLHLTTYTPKYRNTHQNTQKDTHTHTQTGHTHIYKIFTLITFISSMTKDTKYGRIANRSSRFKGALKKKYFWGKHVKILCKQENVWKYKEFRKQGIRKVCGTFCKEPHS